MKKSKLLIFLLAAVSSVSLMTAASFVGCTSNDNPPPSTEQDRTYTVSFVTGNGGSVVASQEVKEGEKASKPTDPTNTDTTLKFAGWYTDSSYTTAYSFDSAVTGDITLYAKWEETGSGTPTDDTYTVTFNTNGGSAIDPVEVEAGGTVTKPATDPTNTNGQGITFAGWYADAQFTTEFDFTAAINADTTIYARWTQTVTSTVDFGALAEANGNATANQNFPTEGFTYMGIYTFTGGRTEGTNNRVNTQGSDILITLTGVTNSITFGGQGASSGSAWVSLKDPSGKEIEGTNTGALSNGQVFQTVTVNDLPAGTYTLSGESSIRFTTLSVTQVLDLGTPTEIVAGSAKDVDLLIGQEYAPTSITAEIKYDNGTIQTKTISAENMDLTEVTESAAGTYEVAFWHVENGKTVYGTYYVNVYAVERIELGTYTQNGAVTTNLLETYLDGATLDTTALSVIATAKTGTGEDALTDTFVLPTDSDYYTAAESNSVVTVTVAGKYLLNQSTAVTASYNIYKLAAADILGAIDEEGVLNITVDANATAVNATTYKTLTSALQAIEGAEVPDYVIKNITVADGTYKEKVYVNISNVHLKAANVVALADLGNGEAKNSKVVFWYDALAGSNDPSGSGHGTNGSASFSIGSGATGFRAEGITFKNYYNTNDLYIQSQGITGDTQAVALYVEAEQAAFYNCKFTSYHDTLYANKGSHYFGDCWIEGRTDFIFGSTAKSYYDGCEIFVIGANDEKNGGYVCAAQSDATSAFVFNDCNFDGDSHVVDGTAALGRPWGENMKMVVMNSTISAKFSTKEHTAGTAQGERYVMMSGHDPIPANFIEYNNTGAGALIAGTAPAENPVGTYLTAEQIAQYALTTCTLATEASAVSAYELANFFTDWNPLEKELVTVTVASNDGTTTYGGVSLFKGAAVSQDIMEDIIPETAIPEGQRIKGFAATANSDTTVTVGTVTQAITYYLVLEDIPEGEPTVYTATFASTDTPTITSEDAPEGMFTQEGCGVKNGFLSLDNSADTFTINLGTLTAGQTVSITYTGSSSSDKAEIGLKWTLTNLTADKPNFLYNGTEVSTGKWSYEQTTGTVVYTATADGAASIVLQRNAAGGTELEKIVVTINGGSGTGTGGTEEPGADQTVVATHEYDFSTCTGSETQTSLAEFFNNDGVISNEGTVGLADTDLRFASGHLKVSSNAGKIVITLKSLKAGDTVNVTMNAKSGSSIKDETNTTTGYKTVTLTPSATNATVTSELKAGSWGDGATMANDAKDQEVSLTVTADGDVVITLNRGGGTVQLYNLTVEVLSDTPAQA